ncbi:MAG TPA: hypothetical protein VFJ65_09560 [Solirubrobacterales bacterium]|nr:hypothetical protein [Solirubrobacterales bacterium]
MEALMMESEVSNWNDDRLDELNRRVDEGFVRVDERFVRLEGEMKEGFARVDKRFEQVASRKQIGEVQAQLGRLTDRIDRLYALLIVAMFSVAGALIANGALT